MLMIVVLIVFGMYLQMMGALCFFEKQLHFKREGMYRSKRNKIGMDKNKNINNSVNFSKGRSIQNDANILEECTGK